MLTQGRIASGDDPRGARGRARMRQISIETKAEMDAIVGELLAVLPAPTIAERIGAEVLASAVVRARRKRARGQNDVAERREIARLMLASPALGGAFAKTLKPATA